MILYCLCWYTSDFFQLVFKNTDMYSHTSYLIRLQITSLNRPRIQPFIFLHRLWLFALCDTWYFITISLQTVTYNSMKEAMFICFVSCGALNAGSIAWHRISVRKYMPRIACVLKRMVRKGFGDEGNKRTLHRMLEDDEYPLFQTKHLCYQNTCAARRKSSSDFRYPHFIAKG